MNYISKNSIAGVVVLLVTIMAQADAGLPDPTRPADYSVTRTIEKRAPTQKAEFNVNAIRISEVDRSAIVNGRLVRIGDEIGTAKVKEINISEIVLDFERKLLTVPLYTRSVNKQFKPVNTRK